MASCEPDGQLLSSARIATDRHALPSSARTERRVRALESSGLLPAVTMMQTAHSSRRLDVVHKAAIPCAHGERHGPILPRLSGRRRCRSGGRARGRSFPAILCKMPAAVNTGQSMSGGFLYAVDGVCAWPFCRDSSFRPNRRPLPLCRSMLHIRTDQYEGLSYQPRSNPWW